LKKPSVDFLFATEIKIQDVEIPYMYFESLVVKKNFLDYRFPFMVLTMNMPPKIFYEILRDVDISDPVVKVNLNTFYKATDLEEDSPFRLHSSGEYLGVIDTPYLSYSPFSDGEPTERGISQAQQENQVMRIALYKKKDINAFKYDYINTVMKNFTVLDALGYGFNTATNGDMKLIISPPDNTTSYKQDLIAPMGFYQFVRYLDNEMGIYDTSYNIFIDDGVVYILNKKNDHGIKLKSTDEYEKTIKIKTIAADEGPKQNSLDMRDDWTYYVLEENDIKNELILERFGNVESIVSNIDPELTGPVGPRPYDEINVLEMKSNRFKHHKKTKFDTELMDVYLGNLPLDVKPYTYFKLEGKLSNNKYRIAGYTTVIQGKRSLSKLKLLRVT
jgi:hypothetical protein